MKKTIYLLVFVIALFSCKKESNISPSTVTNPTNSITCTDNPNINFTSIGTPIGKFGECIKDIDGNTYKTVTIGTQTWMAENLKVIKYNDGTAIPNVTENSQWQKNTTGAWCSYNNSDSLGKIYGKLYNWYAVSPTTNGNKNVCPTGWHVPNNIEWDQLIKLLGGDTIAGAKLKEIGSNNWTTPNEKTTNISLFTAIPSGGFISGFKYLYNGAVFWSSDENSNYDWLAWNASVGYNGTYVDFDDESKTMGASIRCIKD